MRSPSARIRPCRDVGRAIPPDGVHLPSQQSAASTFEGSSREAPSCGGACQPRRRPCTRQTIPAKKSLRSGPRLDDPSDHRTPCPAAATRATGELLVEVTDGTADYNADHYRLSPFYDLAKVAVNRLAWTHAKDLGPRGATSVSLTPGWLRSEMMLDAYGVTEANWRDATAQTPHFAISETPRFVGRAVAAFAADPDRARWNGQSLSSGQLAPGLRLHRPRRLAARRLALHRRGPGRRQASRYDRLSLDQEMAGSRLAAARSPAKLNGRTSRNSSRTEIP